jgi:hypothetical protein
MKAFYVANNATSIQTESDYRRQVGVIPDLEPGNYLVFAKADVGTNVAGGYPPPPWPDGGGALTLAFGGVPESGQNNENVALMIAAKTDSRDSARLYFQALSPLRIAVNSVRLAALQLDELDVTVEGGGPEDPEVEENAARAAAIRRAMTDVEHARLVSDVLSRITG